MYSRFYIIVALLFSFNLSYGQPGGEPQNPCDDDIAVNLIVPGGTSINQSTTQDNYVADLAIDGNVTNNSTARTTQEINGWLEVDLGDVYHLNGVNIWYPSNEGMANYYILYSPQPFSGTELGTELSSPTSNHIFVETQIPSGQQIPIEESARYIRIQKNGLGTINVSEIEIPGTNREDCNNGEDDDCDGLIDCEDDDCSPQIYNVQAINPTCPICEDGEIHIQAFDNSGNYLQYSIDGGITYEYGGSLHSFTGLDEGNYNVFVTNGICTTEYYMNPVILEARAGGHEHCFNGSFEEGSFESWTGGLSFYALASLNLPFPNEDIGFPARHNILQSSNNFDQYAGQDIPLTSPVGDTYFARLGSDDGDNRFAEKLTYCFTVDEDNADFYFHYAAVFQDGNDGDPNSIQHDPDEQAFFQWRILDEDGNPIGEEDKIEAEKSNPNLINVENTAIVYTGWTCVERDLSDFIGEELCVEFVTSHCVNGGHFGYAYIDGLCSNPQPPIPMLNVNDVICQNQTAMADGSGSSGFNRYSWEVCRFIGGNPIQCFSTDEFFGFSNPMFDDILSFFFDDSHNIDPINCGDQFEVKLRLYNNDCSSSEITKSFTYICEDIFIDYPNLVICGLTNQDFPIIGTNDCEDNCTINWTPGQYLDNPTIPFPTILSSLNELALEQTYHVTVENEHGCMAEDEVEIFTKDEITGGINLEVIEENHCDESMLIHIDLDNPLSTDEITVQVFITGETPFYFLPEEAPPSYPFFPPETIEATPQFPGVSQQHTYLLENKIFSKRYNYEVTVEIFYEEGTEFGLCSFSQTFQVSAGIWHGSILSIMPAQFSPNSPTQGFQTFSPDINPNPIDGDIGNVYEAWMRVFDGDGIGGGGEAFIGHVSVDPNTATTGLLFTEPNLTWDGTIDGEPANAGVYTWTFGAQNCDFSPKGCAEPDPENWDSPLMFPIGDCDDCETIPVHLGASVEAPRWCGSVTLFY